MPSTASSKTLNPAVENGASQMEGAAEGDGYRAKRYALKFQPPCVFLEYEDATKRRRVRAVRLSGVQPNVDVDRLTRKVVRSFPRRLDPTSVKYDQVRRLVVALVDFLGGGANGTDGAAAAALGRNGTSSHVPSRLGPGGGGGAAATAAAASRDPASAGSKPPGRLRDLAGGGRDGDVTGSASSPMPSMSPRGLDPIIGPAARLAMSGLNGNYRGSVESNMSRFSTSTASASSSSTGEGEEMEEELEEEDSGDSGGGSGLASALDELDKEMAGTPGYMSDLSTQANGGSAGASSELDSHTSSFSLRDGKALPGITPLTGGKLPPVGVAPGSVGKLLPPPVMAVAAAGPRAGPAAAASTRFAAEAEKLVIGMEVTEDLDLNKVTEVELRIAKQVMETDFQKNLLKPGDPGYVYDKQEEFGPPTLDNDWDESGDEEEVEAPARLEDPEVDWAEIHASVSKPKGAFTAVQVRAGLSSGSDSGSKTGQSPYNSNDWP